MATYTLIIDQGGHSTRAIIFNQKGEPTAYSSEPVDDAISQQTGIPAAHHIEYAIDPIIESTQQLLQRLVQQLSPKQASKIDAVAVIAQRSSIIACDKTGNAITHMISWQDTRNADWLEQQLFNQDALQALTGLRNNPHMGASKMRWLLDNDDNIRQYADDDNLIFMPWGAYFLQRLSQTADNNNIKLITDPILAARTGLVEYQQQQWSTQLLKLYNISENYLPSILSSTHQYGSLPLANREIPINLLGGDQNFIPCAYGVDNAKKNIYLNMGTGAFIQAHMKTNHTHGLLQTAIASEKASSITVKGNANEKNSNFNIIEGTVNAAATALDWWQAQLARPFSYTEIDHIIERNTVAPIFINTLAGTGSPYWLNATTPVFLPMNDDEEYNEEQKTLAVIESILFACKVNIDIILKQNTDLSDIIISGGLARSDTICQLIADLTTVRVKRYDDSEASARGALFYLLNKKDYSPSSSVNFFTPAKDSSRTTRMQERLEIYHNHMILLAKT